MFFVFLLFFALFIDLVTDKVQPLSRTIALDDTPGDPNKAFLTNFNLQFGFAPVAYVGFGVSLQLQTDQVGEVFIVHVGGTRCATSFTDHTMKIHARIILTVEFIRTCICLFFLYV